MAESRLVPSNLMSWPKIRTLLPDQKLIVYHLWATAPTAAGCFLLDFGGFQGALNIVSEALEDAISEFQRRGLVNYDEESGEILILDWFRFHRFKTPVQIRLLREAVTKIQSIRLKNVVLNKINELEINLNPTLTQPNLTPPSPIRGRGDGGREGSSDLSDQIVLASIWEMTNRGKPIKDLTSFEEHIRKRLRNAGPTDKDLQTVTMWQTANDLRHQENGSRYGVPSVEETNKLLAKYGKRPSETN